MSGGRGDQGRRSPKGGGAPKGRLADFVVERLIGVGGVAEVYLGRAVAGPWEGRSVAIKRLRPDLGADPEILDRFLAEADLARLVDHPSLVEVLGGSLVGDEPYLVMEYVDGTDLACLIDECRRREIRLPVPICVYVVDRVLEAAGVIHAAVGRDGSPLGVVHRDLNPGNIFLSRGGEVKVGDLGAALVGALEGGTERNVTMGKLSYLSPEQAGGHELDGRSDLFSVGVMLHELLTGALPFTAKDPAGLLVSMRKAKLKPGRCRPDLPDGLSQVIKRSLALKPRDRFPDAEAFREALEPFDEPAIGNDLAVAALVGNLFPAPE